MPIEKKSASKRSTVSAAAGVSTIMPKTHLRKRGAALASNVIEHAAGTPPNSSGIATMGTRIRTPAPRAASSMAASCARSTAGVRSSRRTPRIPRKGLVSLSGVKPRMGLSAPASSSLMVVGRPADQSNRGR